MSASGKMGISRIGYNEQMYILHWIRNIGTGLYNLRFLRNEIHGWVHLECINHNS
jgi:hypothetical protein